MAKPHYIAYPVLCGFNLPRALYDNDDNAASTEVGVQVNIT